MLDWFDNECVKNKKHSKQKERKKERKRIMLYLDI